MYITNIDIELFKIGKIMKSKLLIMLLVTFVFISIDTYSLTKFRYRGIAFNSSGEIMANQKLLELTIEIIKTSGVVYKENHVNVKTDQFGAYIIKIGTGTVESGNLANVTATKDMKIKSAVKGGGVWVVSTILKPTTAITDFSDTSTSGGRPYPESVTIGSQVWKTKNLAVSHYRNGDTIPQVANEQDWSNLTTGAWCYYNNEESNNDTYGKLYNWYAVNDPRGLAPAGWHIPTDDEWKTLEIELGMTRAQANAINERGTNQGSQLAGNASRWSSGTLKNNANFGTSGFVGLPGGYRYDNARFQSIGEWGIWWTASEYSGNGSGAWYRNLSHRRSTVIRLYEYKKCGYSVRLVHD